MDAFQIIAPLLGVLLGGALSGFSRYYGARTERRRIIATALTDLLEVRHRVVGANLILATLRSTIDVPPQLFPALRNLLDRFGALDAQLDERYNNAISLLAGIDPLLAFSMRSKNTLPRILAEMRMLAANLGADIVALETIERDLLVAVKPTIDAATMELARAHSPSTARKVKSVLEQSAVLPPEFLKLLAGLKSSSVPGPKP